MRATIRSFALAATFAAAAHVTAAVNDSCNSPLPLFSGSTVTGTTATATTDGPSLCYPSGRDVWFSFTPVQSGTVRIDTCGSNFDTVIDVFAGTCASLIPVTCNDETSIIGPCSDQPSTSYVEVQMNVGTTYLIRLSGAASQGFPSSGDYFILLTDGVYPDVASGVPGSDRCADAPLLVSGVPVVGTNVDATIGEGVFSVCRTSGRDVWFRYTPTCSGIVTLNACGSDFDTVLSVYTGPCHAVDEIACNDDALDGTPCGNPVTPRSYIRMEMTAGVEYRIRLAGAMLEPISDTGTYRLLVQGPGGPAPQPPTGVDASEGKCGGVTVMWNPAPNATGYEVWRSASNDPATAQPLAVVNASPFNDETATPGTAYFYWVRSAFACGVGALSVADQGTRGAAIAAAAATTDRNPVCPGDAITLSAPGAVGGVQNWYAEGCGSGAPIGTGASITINAPATTTTYYARVEGDCGVSGCASITVNVGAALSATLALTATSACAGDQTVMSALGGGGGAIRWYRDGCGAGAAIGEGDTLALAMPDTPTTFYARVENACGDSECGELTLSPVAMQRWYRDADGDGFGDAGEVADACSAPAGYVANSDDCNDGCGDCFPGAAEICDGVDNDCDGATDEDGVCGAVQNVWYLDADGDGFGDGATRVESESQPEGHVNIGGDCDDRNPEIFPGAEETCNSLDDNCNGRVDEDLDCTTPPVDACAPVAMVMGLTLVAGIIRTRPRTR